MRIRPPSPLVFRGVHFAGSARRNGATTHHQTSDSNNPLPRIGLVGNAQIRGTTVANKTAAGTTPLAKLSVGSGGALARRRSKGQGVSPLPLRGLTFGSTVIAIDADTAVVQLFNSSGNPSGFGPSEDPEGVFFGNTSLVSGDVWFVSISPAGCTITPLPGGSFTIAVAGGTTTGIKTFTWTLRKGVGGVRSTGTKDFTVT